MTVNLYKALESCYKYRSMKPVDDKWGCHIFQLHDDDDDGDGGGIGGDSGDDDNDGFL